MEMSLNWSSAMKRNLPLGSMLSVHESGHAPKALNGQKFPSEDCSGYGDPGKSVSVPVLRSMTNPATALSISSAAYKYFALGLIARSVGASWQKSLPGSQLP